MAEHQLTCAHCGAQFITLNRRNQQKYCGATCSVAAKNAQKRAARCKKQKASDWTRATARPCVCVVCGRHFTPKASDRTTCCGRECGTTYAGFLAMARKTGGRVFVTITKKKCLGCGKMHSRMGAYCQEECMPSRYAPVIQAKCRQCAAMFTRGHGSGSMHFCSDECKKTAHRISARPAKKRRRAIERGANGGECVDPSKVFARDGWKCCKCRKPTPSARRGSIRSNAPELDHIVPVSRGGSHTYSNTQCLCRSCNAEKGARVEGQLHLFPMG